MTEREDRLDELARTSTARLMQVTAAQVDVTSGPAGVRTAARHRTRTHAALAMVLVLVLAGAAVSWGRQRQQPAPVSVSPHAEGVILTSQSGHLVAIDPTTNDAPVPVSGCRGDLVGASPEGRSVAIAARRGLQFCDPRTGVVSASISAIVPTGLHWTTGGATLLSAYLAPHAPRLAVYTVTGSNVSRRTYVADAAWPGTEYPMSPNPDGTRYAFSRDGRSSGGVWVMNADGSHARQVLQAPGVGVGPVSWSPDGTRIAYIAWPAGSLTHPVTTPVRPTPQARLFVTDLAGSTTVDLGPAFQGEPDGLEKRPWFAALAWSPDSSQIVYTAQANPSGNSLRVTDLHGRSHALNVSSSSPGLAWIPAPTGLLTAGP